MSRLAATLIVGAVVIGGFATVNHFSQFTGTVVRIVDGDTLIASVGGKETTIRLLNVDTPETKDPNQPPECLGVEATEYLNGRLPAGTKIKLEYDAERFDRYGRTLAAVFESEEFISAEIARRGLGAAVVFEPNRKYYQQVSEAQEAARAAGVGLFDPTLPCTIPAQVNNSVTQLTQGAPAAITSTEAADAAAGIGAALQAGETLPATLDVIESGTHAVLAGAHRADVTAYRARLEPALNRGVTLTHWYKMEYWRLQQEEAAAAEAARLAEQARLAEEARLAAEQARLAEEAREAEADRLAAEQARLAEQEERAAAASAAKSAPKTATSSAPRPATTTTSNPYPGYTGPRCYAPGGKTWKPC